MRKTLLGCLVCRLSEWRNEGDPIMFRTVVHRLSIALEEFVGCYDLDSSERTDFEEVVVSGYEVVDGSCNRTLEKHVVIRIVVYLFDGQIRLEYRRFPSHEAWEDALLLWRKWKMVVPEHSLEFRECLLRSHHLHLPNEN